MISRGSFSISNVGRSISSGLLTEICPSACIFVFNTNNIASTSSIRLEFTTNEIHTDDTIEHILNGVPPGHPDYLAAKGHGVLYFAKVTTSGSLLGDQLRNIRFYDFNACLGQFKVGAGQYIFSQLKSIVRGGLLSDLQPHLPTENILQS